MADVAGENEADSGSGGSTSAVPDGGNVAEEDADQASDAVTGSNTNYDSGEGVHRCDRCDNFETPSRSAFMAHLGQCNLSGENEAEMETENNNPPPDRMHRKMFECDVCNMKFSNGANMRRHKMRHTGVKPYECRVCQKRFFRKDHLAEHFTTHTKTLPYHCPICNRGFQRQIAMRAHFQNEHVGQHDLVKSCPLCNYRAGSMKSLRVHFFNRHGIDLDSPGPAGSSAAILAAAAHMNPMDSSINNMGGLSVSVTANYSDSGDSTGARSADNATPPMHFLTPHVEISMADAPASFSPIQCEPRTMQSSQGESSRMNGECPGSPQSADSNSNAPSSSLMQSTPMEASITPSISLIPIKQEPQADEGYDTGKGGRAGSNGSGSNGNGSSNGPALSTSPVPGAGPQPTSSSLSSLIKVSPLKSLLREDLKRKIVTRSSSSRARSATSPSLNPEGSPTDPIATTTNGTITSTGPEQPSDSSVWRSLSKRSLSGLQCVFCGIGFPDQTLYFLHKGCHSESNPWKCNICGEQCSNVYEFNSHLLSKSHQ